MTETYLPPAHRPSQTPIIDLAVVSDSTYVETVGVMLHSILRWHDPASLRVHWVHVRMDRQAIRSARELSRAAGLVVNLVAADAVLAAADWPADVNPTIAKIHLPDLLADVCERVLYLDGDLVVEDVLWPMWEIELGDAALAGVRDSWVGCSQFWSMLPRSVEVAHELWMRPHYINAGVLLYDVARCRALDLGQRCTSWIRTNPAAHFFEQDALNVVLDGAIALAHPAWNVHGGPDSYVLEAEPRSGYSTGELRSAYRQPKIIHFAGSQKPWGEAKHWLPLSRRYFRARRRTPWHRDLSVAEHLHLAALTLAHRVQCHRQLRAARAIQYAGRAVLSIDTLVRSLRASDHAAVSDEWPADRRQG
ncbi:MAG TPA: glycosyltransferase [Terriglobales bacterium]|nr:glycosyltransferase [Terriglobales bacterium]